jgi:hypothetical protein
MPINEIERLRELPLGPILESLCLTGRREGSSVKYTDLFHAINVTGSKWFDHRNDAGGYGAIDLVIHMQGLSFRDACIWLGHPNRQATATYPRGQNEQRPVSFSKQMQHFARKCDTRWPEARNYLITHRAIPVLLVEDLFHAGKIYATDRRSVAFPHYGENGQLAGCSLRSYYPGSQFRQSLGDKTGAWFVLGNLNAPYLVTVESPIEALSYYALHPAPDTAIVSVSGCYVPQQLLKRIERTGQELVVALNTDPAGCKGYAQAVVSMALERSRFQFTPNEHRIITDAITQEPDAAHRILTDIVPGLHIPNRMIPPFGKDWNDSLKERRRQSHRPQHIHTPRL